MRAPPHPRSLSPSMERAVGDGLQLLASTLDRPNLAISSNRCFCSPAWLFAGLFSLLRQSDSALAKGMNWGMPVCWESSVAFWAGCRVSFFVMREGRPLPATREPITNTDPNHPTVSHQQ